MEKAKGGRSGLVVAGVALLFVAPIVAAWAMILLDWRPGITNNNGHLLQPPLAIAELPLTDLQGERLEATRFNGFWDVLVTPPAACEAACTETLDKLSRVHLALNKDMDRVRVAVLLPEDAPAPELPEQLGLLRAAGDVQRDIATAGSTFALDGPTVHVVDPRGWLILSYTYPLDASGLLDDMQRLLRASDEKIERAERTREEV